MFSRLIRKVIQWFKSVDAKKAIKIVSIVSIAIVVAVDVIKNGGDGELNVDTLKTSVDIMSDSLGSAASSIGVISGKLCDIAAYVLS